MEKVLTLALAGNANVGKSAIFNQLTGLSQIIGNWPGKTVERAEGTLRFNGYKVKVLDLPGIYSLSTYSLEEIISREYIAVEKPDVVVNVVDASALERNLYFTLQLLELETPMVMALNMVDFASQRGIEVDEKKLEEILGIPIVSTIATRGVGIHDLLHRSIEVMEKKDQKRLQVRYGKEIEEWIDKVADMVAKKIDSPYPHRWLALKLLEEDEEVLKLIRDKKVISLVKTISKEIERLHGEPCPTVIASERWSQAQKIANAVQRLVVPPKPSLGDYFDRIALHKIFGYPILLLVMSLIFFVVFYLGEAFSQWLGYLLGQINPWIESLALPPSLKAFSWIWRGLIEGAIAGITIALPFILPFYIMLAIMESTGYLARIAFLMDNLMHLMGLHGKAFIPIVLGYGCNVPAILGCRIMETERERFIAAFLSTLVPCSARLVVIMGLVGVFFGIQYVLAMYLFNLLLIFFLGRVFNKYFPGRGVGLIMEVPPLRMPSLKVTAKQTWVRIKDFIYIAFPIIMGGSLALETLKRFGLLESLGRLVKPIIVDWLGLPLITGIVLIFGILRKELTLIMLVTLSGTTNFMHILSPVQMLVFALVTMLYIPCVATIAALIKEFGWGRTLFITLFVVAFALLIGGLAYRIFSLI